MRLAFDDAINVGERRRGWSRRRSLVLRSPLGAAGRPAIEAGLGERLAAAFERGGQAGEVAVPGRLAEPIRDAPLQLGDGLRHASPPRWLARIPQSAPDPVAHCPVRQ